MAKEIIWTPQGGKSHDALIAYLAKEWSQKEVLKYIQKVNSILHHINVNPFVYRYAGKEDIREAALTKHNILLYRVSGHIIYLLYFWDTRKNPARKLKTK